MEVVVEVGGEWAGGAQNCSSCIGHVAMDIAIATVLGPNYIDGGPYRHNHFGISGCV